MMKRERRLDWSVHRAIDRAVMHLLTTGATSATAILSPTQSVRVSRRMYGRPGKRRFDPRTVELSVTIGKPNYDARLEIRRRTREGRTLKPIWLQYAK